MMRPVEWRAKWNRLLEQSRRRGNPETSPFPTAAQLDLLKAALLPADQAAPAWRRWKARGLELETADSDSIRMLSQLWTNRAAAGIGADDLPLIKGVYRKAFASNAVSLRAAIGATELLATADVPALLLKGAALLASTQQLGLRLIGDVDVLVPEADARRTIDVLSGAGYTGVEPSRPVGVTHAWACWTPDRARQIDVHWWAFKTAGDDTAMFETAEPARLFGRQVLVPSATDMLLTIVANAFPGAGAPLRWIADAMVISQIGSIDWDVVLERTRRPGLTLNTAAGLEFLSREFGMPVPPHVIAELRGRRVHWVERAAHWAVVNDPGFGRGLLDQAERYRARRLHPVGEVPRDFVGHLAQIRRQRRRDVVRRAPRTALRTAAVLAIRAGERGRSPGNHAAPQAASPSPSTPRARHRGNGDGSRPPGSGRPG